MKLQKVKTKKYEKNLMNLKCQWETLVTEFVSSSDKEIICEDQNNIINKLD